VDNENLDRVIRKMLEDGDTFCDHSGPVFYKKEAPCGWHRAYCSRCFLWSLAKPSVIEAEQSFREETRRKLQRYEEIKMSTADYKRGVEDTLAELDTLPKTAIAYVRKKLLTKKVTKWTGIITSPWSGLPTILELCDTEEEVKEFLAKNPKPLTKAIPIEIETKI